MFKNISFFLATMLIPSIAFAQTAPSEPVDIVKAMIEAFKGGNWSVFASLTVMAVVWLATKAPGLSNLIKGKAKIWVAATAGMLMAVATTVFTTGDWMAAIGQGLSIGLGATGLFELIKRKVAHQPIDANNDGQLDDLSNK